jgi:hypothetical protein
MPNNARDWIIVLWPAFFAACGLAILTFAALDPSDVDLFGWGLELDPITTYSLAFLAFWAICGSACLVTWSLARGAGLDAVTGSSPPRSPPASPPPAPR